MHGLRIHHVRQTTIAPATLRPPTHAEE
jgi:hypothetical protein